MEVYSNPFESILILFPIFLCPEIAHLSKSIYCEIGSSTRSSIPNCKISLSFLILLACSLFRLSCF